MDEVHGFGEKAKAISHAVRQVCRFKGDLTNNRDKLLVLVNGINSLILPRGWVGVDDEGSLHYTYVAKERATDAGAVVSLKGPQELSFSADYIWAYRPCSRTYECIKDREFDNRGKLFRETV